MSKKKSAPSEAMVMEVFALAQKLGWTSLNDAEKRLIETLRRTTYHGRNIVMDVAISMRKAHPWTDDGSPLNTQTHPVAESHFSTEVKKEK